MIKDYNNIDPNKPMIRTCRVCGCDDDHACKGGCYWVEPDLCSQCYEKEHSFSIKIRKVKFIGADLIDIGSEVKVIADEIPDISLAEGYVWGYAAGKEFEEFIDMAIEDEIDSQAIGISIWQGDDVKAEFYFISEKVEQS